LPEVKCIFIVNSVLKTFKGTEVHTKNLTFLLRLLQTSKESGILFVEPSEQNGSHGGYGSAWQGQFQLDKGVVTSCLIRNKIEGQVWFSNDEAVNWLAEQGKLEWHLAKRAEFSEEWLPPLLPYRETPREHLREDVAPVLLPSSAEEGKQLSDIPQRIFTRDVTPVNALPSRAHRQVFALIDGQRTVEDIMHLLHKKPELVIQVLQELRGAGFIA